ncbi:MAG: cytochrome c3 family protein [Myxococcota bacterium]
MQRVPSILRLPAACVAVWCLAAPARAGDQVFHLTKHGSVTSGVNRLPGTPVGHCMQCHPVRQTPVPMSPVLFAPNDNTLCFGCHAAAGPASVYAGQTAYAAGIHASSAAMRWPGPTPPARPAGDAGKCLNCHTPHGARDGAGLVPNLEYVREEALCLACHDGSGPAAANIFAELTKTAGHPTATVSGRHATAEGSSSAAFGAANRHAECTDCHNPHATTSTSALMGASRVAVTNGAAGTAPTYSYVPPTNAAPVTEYELCFKCHSSWTTRPAGAKDVALVVNPANESFHPVEAPGKTTSSQLAASLAAGGGTPHLTTSSVIACTDCHNNDALPRTVTLLSGYTGAVPKGPHGSSASGGNAAFSNAILRAPYRADLKPRATSNDYTANDFALCFICHSPAPFGTTNEGARADTSFRLHGMHLNKLFDKGSINGSITTPGAGRGNAICRECHYDTHGTRGAPFASNRTYTRGVNFAPNVQGPGGSGEPSWTAGSCRLRCHGTNHNPETY